MMSDRLRLLSSILRYSGQKISVGQFAPACELAPFVNAGLLVPSGLDTLVRCKVCADAHSANVILLDGHKFAICSRSGETFVVEDDASTLRVNGDAIAIALASALQLGGDVRQVPGLDALWRLGGRKFCGSHVNFFFTPSLDQLDIASSVLAIVATRTAATTAGLIVASDRLDHVEMMARSKSIIRLRDIAQMEDDGQFAIDEEQLARIVVPDAVSRRGPGAPAFQRDKIFPILDEMAAEGLTIDTSAESWRQVQFRYKNRFARKHPAKNTVVEAIMHWKESRGSN